ncbi:hypothetical protein BDV30DRAFT_225232 [Aspergillus minisclerotigenes]|uniref:Uncharacterized protein n=1 Tax=Aspergillus minisclerotigenes TaxID=656917 RepID=A0A5N6J8P0_9EURO|nr:hypothetical protein BDV30DRAFT_225232 [Aspergillus minisclerotigenes]
MTTDKKGSALTAEALQKALLKLSMATKAMHTYAFVSPHGAVAPAMHMVVNYRYGRDPEISANAPFDSHVYSRHSAPNINRLNVMLLILFAGVRKFDLSDLERLGPGDVVHVETPLNPTGEARNFAYYPAKAHERGVFLSVDATFAPPQWQDPLKFGADTFVHSKEGWAETLHAEHKALGHVIGSLEGWQGIRSVRTIHLRVMRQAETARLVQWHYEEMQNPNTDASIQYEALKDDWLQKQMPGGFTTLP